MLIIFDPNKNKINILQYKPTTDLKVFAYHSHVCCDIILLLPDLQQEGGAVACLKSLSHFLFLSQQV